MTDDLIDPIVIAIAVPVRPDRAWQAVTEPPEVAEWFADVSPAGAVGEPYAIDFGDGSAIEGRVTALEPGRRLAYTWAWSGEGTEGRPGPRTLVAWDIESSPAGGSIVRLTHSGWSDAGLDATTRDEHAGYWEAYLESLAALLGTA